MLVYLAVSAGVLIAACGREQELVLFYAVAVFVSFLAGLAAMARFSLRDGRRRPGRGQRRSARPRSPSRSLVNLARGYPLLSIAATGAIAATLYALWARAGRPAGVEEVERHLDDPDETPDERADRTGSPA